MGKKHASQYANFGSLPMFEEFTESDLNKLAPYLSFE